MSSTIAGERSCLHERDVSAASARSNIDHPFALDLHRLGLVDLDGAVSVDARAAPWTTNG
jgi:hypothetical protein